MDDFFGKRYKKFFIVPAILMLFFIIMVFIFSGISTGIDITGGNEITLRSNTELNKQELYDILQRFSLSELNISTLASPTGYGALIRYGKENIAIEAENLLVRAENSIDNDEESINYSSQVIVLFGGEEKTYSNAKLALLDAQDALSSHKEAFEIDLRNALVTEIGLGEDLEFQRKEISPTIGSAALYSMIQISIWGLVFITLIIFIAFRKFVPTVAIVSSMLFDVMAGLAGMAIFNIPLSLATIPALLMLIGYSVDTDIMLTARLLKSKGGGSAGEKATASMKTGLTMTGTTLAALSSMIIISYFYQIEVIYYISAILLFGLVGDLVSTWLMNAPLLLWYIEKRGKK
jgi:preprotein translocase subunit SecF